MTMRTCLYCDEPIQGRSDKKFCDVNCRNGYNNSLKQDTNNLFRNVHNTLRRNYRILQELNPNDKSTVYKEDLFRKGFNFDFFTNRFETQKGKVYFYLYDLGYTELENGKLLLVTKQEWMNW